MTSRVAITCLIVLALALESGGVSSGAKAKAKTRDPWDVPDASEELESPLAEGGSDGVDGGDGGEQSPADMAAIIGQYEARHAMAQANSQHAVMKQFMKNFARNMRLSVLRDSKGDMPEAQRQALIAKAEGEGAEATDGEMADGASAFEANSEAESEESPAPRRRLPHRPHMLNMVNMAEAQPSPRRVRRSRHRLLPEAEGIGFPPPPGMAPDPAMMASEAPIDDTPPQRMMASETPGDDTPPQRPHHRHHLRMLNLRPSEHAEPQRKAHGHQSLTLPPGVVRDEMGRAMPVLFANSKSAKGESPHGCTLDVAIVLCVLVMLGFSSY